MVNGFVGGIAGMAVGSSNQAMKFAEREWGWRNFSKYVTKTDWARECSEWIVDDVYKDLLRTTAFEISRYRTSDYLSNNLSDGINLVPARGNN